MINERINYLKYNIFLTVFVFLSMSLFANRANPVLNLNIDTTMVLDMDEESSDVDKVR